MLLNEFLKEHRNVAEQQSTIAELKMTVAQQQQKQIEALTACAESQRASRAKRTCSANSSERRLKFVSQPKRCSRRVGC